MLKIFLILILFFEAIRSPPSSRRVGWALPNCNRYQSISNPNRHVALYFAHPIGPLYVRAMIHFEMNVTTPGAQPITLSVEHHYMRIDGPCRSNLVFSSRNIPVLNMNIRIIIYNDFNDNLPLAVFNYNFDNTYRPIRMKFLDTRTNFGFELRMRRDADEHIPMTSDSREDVKARLSNLPPSEGYICLVTENTDGVAFRVDYDGKRPRGMITKLRRRNYLNGRLTLEAEYPAFECKSRDGATTSNVFISEWTKEEAIEEMIYWTEYTPEPVYRSTLYVLRDDYVVDVTKIDSIGGNAQKVYLLRTKPVLMTCADNTQRSLIKSRDGSIHYAEELKNFHFTVGVNKDSWVAKSPTNPCE